MLHTRRLHFALTLLRTGQFVLAGETIAVDSEANADWRNKAGDVASPFAASLPPRVKNFGCAELLKPGEAKLLICRMHS